MKATLLQRSIAEFLGAFAIVFFGCGAMLMAEIMPEKISHFGVAFSFGMVILVIICALGHISGAHCNPVVSFVFMLKKMLPLKDGFLYIFFQFLGGIFASGIHFLLTLNLTHHFGVPLPLDGSFWTAFIWEIVLTFCLVFVIISMTTDYRAVGQLAGVSIASIVFLAAFVGGPFNGASMNPARFLGPTLFAKEYSYFFAYLVGPLIGGILAMLLYPKICCYKEPCEDKKMSVKFKNK